MCNEHGAAADRVCSTLWGGCAGIVDDIYGADFVNGGKDGNIQDQNGHGTFVSGVVGAMTNNGVGVTGINQVKTPSPLCALLLSTPLQHEVQSRHEDHL